MAYRVAVRELCEFTAKQGDLDLRFTPAPSSQEGIAGHATVASRRGAGYQAELRLSGDYQGRLLVSGRADGWDAQARRLEEVKTYKGRLERLPESHRRLHWAQAKVYGWLLCAEQGLDEIEVALVYFEVGSQQETRLAERCSAEALREHFDAQCMRFLAWAEAQLAQRETRDAQLRALAFPFGDFRAGQRALAEGVYKAAMAGRCLLAQAPTGIGKTLGTLFPLLKAAPGDAAANKPDKGLDKVFFLAAKTSGRQLALDALATLRQQAPALRVLELVARDKSCEYPDRACHGESCPLAQGFYDRLPAARAQAAEDAQQQGSLVQARLREIALAHQVCPYYLSQEMARWADVVVGDYNYFFDLGALLLGLTQANDWRVGLLVDEAHNLVERGRKMFSAELRPETLAEARHASTAKQYATIKKSLDKLRRAWIAMDKAQAADYAVHAEVPASLLAALQQCSSAITEHIDEHRAEHPTEADAALQAFYFEILHLARMAELLDAHSIVDVAKPASPAAKPGSSLLTVRNLVPAPFLKPRFEAARTATLFSATLQPMDYYANLLGLPDRHLPLEVESPFAAEQLQVRIARRISTRYADRAASLAPIAELIAQQYAAAPGNYLAFFSSYDYLEQALATLRARHPALPLFAQARGMSEGAQREFLARFVEGGQGIGFAVLGGAFAEGVDLPGRRLIGAFLATLGLPQLNPVNEQIRARMEQLFGAGYDYTYLYPGLQKVVQAAGRVIRTPEDRGVVHLIDDRFARAEVRRLLPRWWRVA